jgi:hypothetical protein
MPPQNRGGTESEISRILKKRADRFLAGMETLTREFLEPIPETAAAGPGGADLWGQEIIDSDFLSKSVRALATSEDQISLLDRLLEGAARCYSRVCLFIVRDGEACGWSSVGLPESEEGDPAKGLEVPLEEESILSAAVSSCEAVRRDVSEGDIRFLPAHHPGDRLPGTAMAVPLLVLDKVAAVLYADDGGDGRLAHDSGGVEVLASVATLVANRLALLSRPDGLEAEAEMELPVQVPTAEEGGGLLAGSALFDLDPLEEEIAPSPSPDSPGGSGDLSAEEKLLHEDARRFARLLVSELLLYHEDQVILGRKQRDIYSRLRDEIDRSRQAYDQRVPGNVSSRTDYFREELVRTLAGGDSTALGPGMAR